MLDRLHLIDGAAYGDKLTLRHLLKQTSGLRDVYFDGLDNPVSLMPGTADGAHPNSLVGIMAFDTLYGLTPLVQCTLHGLPAGCNPDDYLFRHLWKPWDYAAWQANPQDKMAGLLNFYLAGMNEHALWEPGQGFHYADTNYILLGLVIEKVTAHSLHNELRARIFDPLGMADTYLLGRAEALGATEPPAQDYAKPIAEVWAWNEPAISGGVDFSFDWGGGGVVSTLSDLHKFVRALADRRLFQQSSTLDEMLSVPQDINGLFYASGLIVFPTSHGPVWYMMGSNGSWVEYYPPLDLITAGTANDFSNLPGQFMLHAQVYQILARQGLPTPMTLLSSQSLLLVMLSLMLFVVLLLVWLVVALRQRAKKVALPRSVRWARWLAAASFLANIGLFVLIGMAIGPNPFQMLFGFSPQVRLLFALTALLMVIFALLMSLLALRLHRRQEGTPFDRSALVALAAVTLVYALGMGTIASG